MFNLLPEKHKVKAWRDYEVRRLIVGFLLLFAVLLIALISLLPAYFFSEQKNIETKNIAATFSNSEAIKKSGEISTLVSVANKKVSFLKNNKESNIKQLIEYVVSARVTGVKIISFSFVTKTEGPKELLISGSATNRDTLLLFKKNLESMPGFEGVDLPVSNLAKEKDLTFSLKIFIKK